MSVTSNILAHNSRCEPRSLVSTVLAIVLLAIVAFCVYGFMASFEPGPIAIYFRIGYPVVGLVSIAAAAALFSKR